MARSDSGRQSRNHSIAFLVPGDIEQLSGGYGYDRAVIAEWRKAAIAVEHIALPGDFPSPSRHSLAETRRVLEALEPDRPVLVDGLAFGALPPEIAAASKAPLTVLLHHPLGLETGLSPAESNRLINAEKAALRHASAIIVTSAETARTVRCLFDIADTPLIVAPPGTDERPRAERQGDPPLILGVGSVIPRKGHADLVQAVSRLASLDWRLVIVGSMDVSPETLEALRATIAECGMGERITLAGPMRGAALDRLFADASIFALASHYEGYGMVFAEALASGLPIVGYRAGAVPDVVPHEAGILVEKGDIDALSEAIALLLRDSTKADAMAGAAWAAGRMLTRWPETAARIHAVLHGRELA